MSIKIKPAGKREPLNELNPTYSTRMPIELVRMMVPNMHMGHNDQGIVWQGRIWECIDDGYNLLNYPAVDFDIYVEEGTCTIVMERVYGPGLISQWIKEQLEMPHITAIPRKMAAAVPMRYC